MKFFLLNCTKCSLYTYIYILYVHKIALSSNRKPENLLDFSAGKQPKSARVMIDTARTPLRWHNAIVFFFFLRCVLIFVVIITSVLYERTRTRIERKKVTFKKKKTNKKLKLNGRTGFGVYFVTGKEKDILEMHN